MENEIIQLKKQLEDKKKQNTANNHVDECESFVTQKVFTDHIRHKISSEFPELEPQPFGYFEKNHPSFVRSLRQDLLKNYKVQDKNGNTQSLNQSLFNAKRSLIVDKSKWKTA
jgi:hypothetical protein